MEQCNCQYWYNYTPISTTGRKLGFKLPVNSWLVNDQLWWSFKLNVNGCVWGWSVSSLDAPTFVSVSLTLEEETLSLSVSVSYPLALKDLTTQGEVWRVELGFILLCLMECSSVRSSAERIRPGAVRRRSRTCVTARQQLREWWFVWLFLVSAVLQGPLLFSPSVLEIYTL